MKAYMIFTTLIILNVTGILISVNVYKYKVKFAFEIVDNFEEIKFKSGDFGFKYIKQIAIKLHVFEANTTALWRADQLSRAFREQFSSEISAAEPYHESEVPSRSPTPYRGRNRSRNRRDLRKSQLYKSCAVYYDPDVEEAWKIGYTGKNVTVAVVDTGVYVDHPDLRMNVNIELSHSFVGFNSSAVKPDTLFSYKELNELTDHGTLAAGIIGSERGNQICSAGIAFNATLVGLKVFKLDEEDIKILKAFKHVSFSNEKIPAALEYKRDVIDIYSCSFNLRSAFVKNDIETKTILKEGVTKGRNGKGSIFVFSAGNAMTGDIHDRNMEFYASSVYTITFSSVGKHGKRPSYTQPGSCILAATFGDFRIWAGEILKSTARETQCKKFQGTSAAAARGSGMIALMLEAK
ncbi:neuroendocrine convertase 2-like isoform X2 [Mya arenaria]|uniref:neuroendocrine convertase 2-like isoform X2 n=1 Tax=Mya arenaria TaxID=6604 RepID=UPI0022DF26E1|nr:neuroendocrine convertase 2-like isoform X2 [Mya arenaria]